MLETTTVPPQGTPAQPYPFEFRGNGKEYFRIWIVNLGLTILTLGIYSAWAKVRTRRYFYNHMYLNGQTFDYHADPIKILKGRILLFLMGASWALIGVHLLFVVVPVAFFLLMPYFLVRGAIFNFTNTSYRGVRFGFERAYKESYYTWITNILIAVFTLGIGFLATVFRFKRFVAQHAALGRLRFQMGGTGFEFWVKMIKEPFLYGLAYGISVLILIGVLSVTGLMSKEDLEGFSILGILFTVLGYGFYGFVFVVYQVRSAAYYADHLTADGGIRFKSKLELWETFLMFAEQLFLLVITLGLAWPWVVCNVTKYKMEHLAMIAAPDFFNSLEQGQVDSASAFGEELASFWDFDIGF